MTIDASFMPMVAGAMEATGILVAVCEVSLKVPAGLAFAHTGTALLSLLGYTDSELAGRPFAAIVSPSRLAELEAEILAHRSFRGDLACTAKDGSSKWLNVHLLAVPTSPYHFVMIGQDVTAQRKASAQARIVQSVLLRVFMSFDAAMAVIAADDRILMANASMEALVNTPAGSLTGCSVASLIIPAYRQLVTDQRLAHQGDNESCELDVEIACTALPPVLAAVKFLRLSGAELLGMELMSVTAHPHGTVLPYHLRMAGKIRFVSLQAVQAELGERWEKVAARVTETAEHMIRRRLQPGDVLARTQDHGFTICFERASEEEASELADSLAREIREHLIGTGERQDAVQMAATVTRVAVPTHGAPDMAQIGRHMVQAEEAVAGLPWPEPKREPVFLAADNSIIGSYIRARARQDSRSGAQIFPEEGPESTFAALKAAGAQTPAHLLLVDVRFDSLANRATANAYHEQCLALPLSVRERLYPVISPLPRGTTESLLLDIIRRMNQISAGWGIRIEDLQAPDFNVTLVRPAMAVLDLQRWQGGASVPGARLQRLTTMLHAFRVRVLAVNVASFHVGRDLQRAGVDWVLLDR